MLDKHQRDKLQWEREMYHSLRQHEGWGLYLKRLATYREQDLKELYKALREDNLAKARYYQGKIDVWKDVGEIPTRVNNGIKLLLEKGD